MLNCFVKILFKERIFCLPSIRHLFYDGVRKERVMQRICISLIACLVCVNATAGVNLPVVDVSSGMVSARAAFGEEIVAPKRASVDIVRKNDEQPRIANNEKKVVARSAKKSVNAPVNIAQTNDVLQPHRPSSDLWARNMNDAPLRMPRMDEIAVVRSDDLLPEEDLYNKPVNVAQNVVDRVSRDEVVAELQSLRNEITKLKNVQQNENIVRARPVTVRTPIAGDTDVVPAVKERATNVKREIVSMDTDKDIAMRALSNNTAEPKIASVKKDLSKMSPSELKKALKKTYLSENKHLSTYEMDDAFDVASDMSASIEGFTAQRDLSEMAGGVRPLEVKITFLDGDSGLSRENYNVLSETASIVVNNPKRAIQIAIPESVTYNKDARKLAARRLAIVEQVLRDTGVAEQRIVPVLSQRDGDTFVLRIISNDTFETLTQQKRNMFGDNVSKKTYKSMSW